MSLLFFDNDIWGKIWECNSYFSLVDPMFKRHSSRKLFGAWFTLTIILLKIDPKIQMQLYATILITKLEMCQLCIKNLEKGTTSNRRYI